MLEPKTWLCWNEYILSGVRVAHWNPVLGPIFNRESELAPNMSQSESKMTSQLYHTELTIFQRPLLRVNDNITHKSSHNFTYSASTREHMNFTLTIFSGSECLDAVL
jgi:hypothetical protein